MHIALIGATALILFLIMGGLFISAVVLEQRTRRRMAAAGAPLPADGSPIASEEAAEKPKAMGAAAGR